MASTGCRSSRSSGEVDRAEGRARPRRGGPLHNALLSAAALSYRRKRLLERAGVTRAELFADSGDETRKAITFHGLRATGITRMAARGDDPLRIKQRAGHKAFTTTEGYIREAENLGASFGTVFPALPDLARGSAKVSDPDETSEPIQLKNSASGWAHRI